MKLFTAQLDNCGKCAHHLRERTGFCPKNPGVGVSMHTIPSGCVLPTVCPMCFGEGKKHTKKTGERGFEDKPCTMCNGKGII